MRFRQISSYLQEQVPANKFLFAGKVQANKFLFAATVPANLKYTLSWVGWISSTFLGVAGVGGWVG